MTLLIRYLSPVDVLETIAADATILTLAGTDVDGDTLTYSLSGDDAELFNVDSSGNLFQITQI